MKHLFTLQMPPSELVPEVNPFEGLGDKMNGCPIS